MHKLLFFIYFLIISIGSATRILSFDTFYYWDWSRHLALSYYDGPPMIAYWIKLSTMFFGNTLFALAVIGIATTALTSLILFKTARLFLNQSASLVAVSLWLFSPLVTLDLLTQTTYDTPLTLFWALTLYFVIKYIQTPATKYLYAIGVCIGMLLLSKYSGIVLVIGIVVFLVTNKFRYLFRSRHFYCAICIAILLFSPVIIWNNHYEWQSFLYQLNTHRLKEVGNPFIHFIQAFVLIFVPSLNVMLLPPLLYGLKELRRTSRAPSEATFCFTVSLVFLVFYLISSASTVVRVNWLMQFLMTSALLGGYFYQRLSYHRSFHVIISAYVLISLSIIGNAQFHFIKSGNYPYYLILEQFNKDYPEPPKIVITSGWFEARMLYFLKNKPLIYTLDCASLQNQYELWSKEIRDKILSHEIKNILYIDTYDRISYIKKFFSHCQKLSTIDYQVKQRTYHIFAYQCS